MKFEVGLSAKLVMGWIFFRNFTGTTVGVEIQTFSNLLVSIGVAGIFFLSIALHELSHAIIMTVSGIKVEKIKLMFFGGYTQAMEGYGDHDTWPPFKDFCISIVGPLSNIIFALILYSLFFDNPAYRVFEIVTGTENSHNSGGIGNYLISYAVFFNLLVGVFNLVPVLPLDGGHVLRSILLGCFKRRWLANFIPGVLSLAAGLYGLYFLSDNLAFGSITDQGILGIIDSLFNLGLLGLLCLVMTIMGIVSLRKSLVIRTQKDIAK